MAYLHVLTFLLQFLGVIFWTHFALGQYEVGVCHPPLIKEVFNRSVTLEMMAEEGEYTVVFTSGLKQYESVTCARFGYNVQSSGQAYEFYSYVETSEKRQLIPYPVLEVIPGKFMVKLMSRDVSFHYIAYKVDDLLLLYWCKHEAFADNNYNNNIWLIAAKTRTVRSKATQKAVLDMLYHDDYRSLIDNDIFVEYRPNPAVRKYLELKPCDSPTFSGDIVEPQEANEVDYTM